MILRLGVGDTVNKQEGYLNIDLRDLPNIDIVADAAKLPFTDGEHEGIESRNLVEHFSRHEIDAVFQEWARVLKKGGKLTIETVDVGALMTVWQSIPEENWMDGLLGAQTYPENFHKMAFTMSNMTRKLADAGFSIIHFRQFTHRQIPRMLVEAIKV